MDLAALTDRGKVRDNNEDHYIVARFDRAMRTLLTNLPKGEVPGPYAETVYGLLVADGVGGQQAGEVASRTAIQAIVDLVIDTPDWIMRLDEPLERGSPGPHGAPIPEGARAFWSSGPRATRSCAAWPRR